MLVVIFFRSECNRGRKWFQTAPGCSRPSSRCTEMKAWPDSGAELCQLLNVPLWWPEFNSLSTTEPSSSFFKMGFSMTARPIIWCRASSLDFVLAWRLVQSVIMTNLCSKCDPLNKKWYFWQFPKSYGKLATYCSTRWANSTFSV